MFKGPLNNKTKRTCITIAVLLVIVIAFASALILKSSNTNNQTPVKISTTKASADALKDKAIEALYGNNTKTAKAFFQDAKQQYQDLGDTNNVIDVEAQLYMIEHPSALK